MVESTRPMEHEVHARHLGDVPRVDVLVKAGLAADEAGHVRDGADVPGRDWSESLPRRRGIADPRGPGVVEVRPGAVGIRPLRRVLRLEAVVDGHVWTRARVKRHRVALVEGSAASEHGKHGAGLAHVPRADVLIERGSTVEHAPEGRDLPDLPRVERVVESTRPMEHEVHARHLGDVPRVDVLVKAGLAADEAGHVRDGADVPGRDWSESLPRRRGIADPRGQGVLETVLVGKQFAREDI